MKIVFFGSDDFAVTNLQALIQSGRRVMACVTPPDPEKGRGLRTSFPPVKACALEHEIPVFQPDSLEDGSFLRAIRGFQSDLFVVIAYGKVLPESLLSVPRLFSVNVHASLLPKYRGAAPINWAIINGERQTGVTVIKLSPCIDAGDILSQSRLDIEDADTAVTLREKLARLGAGLLNDTIQAVQSGQVQCVPQERKEATFAPKLTKQLGKIDWQHPAQRIHNLVRGLQPWPSAYTFYKGKLLKILETEVVSGSAGTPGTVIGVVPAGFIVQTGDQGLCVRKVHLASAKAMVAEDFVRGHRLDLGMRF
ncbi:MAG TPA: methionyl-tRNA formyltransferase [Candidatus Omnitrophota bacterium]|jgi:methionyl-tRNA formyltransferase|nr:methionyl-tRNA formyltransferase [Candidatus Omnitrophota bacterium]HPN55796.1 methionyl-tRNA formyltransferase [Candidatus Omnitrophota bacterium]